MNLHSRALKALLNAKIVIGQTAKFTVSDGNSIYQIPAVATGGSGGHGNAFVIYGTINAPIQSADYFSITSPFGDTTVQGVIVYKPEELRTSRASEVLYNGTNYITVSYSYNANGTQRTSHVTASVPNNPGYDDETHVVIPQYIVQGTVNGAMRSSAILAISYDGGFTYIDVNAAGRVWSGVSTDPAP